MEKQRAKGVQSHSSVAPCKILEHSKRLMLRDRISNNNGQVMIDVVQNVKVLEQISYPGSRKGSPDT